MYMLSVYFMKLHMIVDMGNILLLQMPLEIARNANVVINHAFLHFLHHEHK